MIKLRLWPRIEFFSSGGQESQRLFVQQQPFIYRVLVSPVKADYSVCSFILPIMGWGSQWKGRCRLCQQVGPWIASGGFWPDALSWISHNLCLHRRVCRGGESWYLAGDSWSCRRLIVKTQILNSILAQLSGKFREKTPCTRNQGIWGNRKGWRILVHSIGNSQLNFLPSLCYHSPPLEASLKNNNNNKHRATIWPSNPSTGHTPWENHNSKKHKYSNVQSSTVYHSQDKKAT